VLGILNPPPPRIGAIRMGAKPPPRRASSTGGCATASGSVDPACQPRAATGVDADHANSVSGRTRQSERMDIVQIPLAGKRQ
jgi:hypothetical protein